ncbi:MAG: hypothetical protein V1729_06440 [Candidatus Woesearchaeota archaeon]
MKDKDYKKFLELLEKLAHKCHLVALKGTMTLDMARSIATNLEVRFEEKELVHADSELKKLEAEIKEHLVSKAEKSEIKVLTNIVKAIKNLYLSMFNVLVFERKEILDLDEFVTDVMKDIPSSDFKKEVAKMIQGLVNKWQDNLRSMHQAANGVFAAAKERKSVALMVTDMLHTHGAGYMKRLQEQRLLKDAHKEEVKAQKTGKKITKRKFHSKEEAEKLLAQMEVDETKSIEEYKKACKLLALDWEFGLEELDRLEATVGSAVKAHELPSMDDEQLREIRHRVLQKLIEPFTHSIEQGVNQLNALKNNLDSHTKGLNK